VKTSEFYTTELVKSYFHLCEHDYHHNCVDIDALATGTVDVDEDLVALYLGYYDWGSLHSVVSVSNSDNSPFVDILCMACVVCDT
jgi:hypothetical protein